MVIPLFLLGCNNHISVYGNKVHVADGEVSLDYHNKDLSQDFLSFLESPVKSTANFRSADADDELDETDYFAMIWDSLSEEEKNDVMQNLDSLQMEGVMSIATEVDTPAGRAAANEDKAATAVNTAKTVFYDPKAAYNLPWWEIAFLGDTSHNGTNEFSYCSKVAYTSWKKAGSDLDGNTFAGNLVTPDDIYSSSYNHYFTFTLKILWWTKTWEIQTYTATSNVEQEYHQ